MAPSRDVRQDPPLVFDANFLAHSAATLATTATASVDCSGATGSGDDGGRNREPKAKVKLGRKGSDEPKMKLTVTAGSEKLRSAKLRLPRELRFAGGGEFDRGTTVAKVSVKSTRRALKLRARPAERKLVAKVADGALLAGKGLSPSSRPKFKLVARDAEGRRTKLTVRAGK